MSISYSNLKGKRFGKLVAIEQVEDYDNNGTTKKWRCQCDCGNFINISARLLNEANKKNKNISCGCSRKKDYTGNIYGDYLVLRFKQDGDSKFRQYYCKCVKCNQEVVLNVRQLDKGKLCQDCHKKEAKTIKILKHKLCSIRRRCYVETSQDYKNYGARGIKVCEEWLGDSDKFVKWALENGYQEGLTIDRIDNNKNYCPENCRWVDRLVQNNNKRNNLNIEYNGKTQTLKQWCRELNLPYRKTYDRLYELNWSLDKAFTYKK